MAVTELQRPPSYYYNASKSNMVYTLSSDNVDYPQFRYVVDVYPYWPGSDPNTPLTRLKFYPNENGTVNFDMGRVFDSWLDYDKYWQVTGSIQANESWREFRLYYGEEYGTSVSSSRTVYTGSVPSDIFVFPGNVYDNEGSFYFSEINKPVSYVSGERSSVLTDAPGVVNAHYGYPPGLSGSYIAGWENYQEDVLWVTKDDYHTITVYEAFTANAYVVDKDNYILYGQPILSSTFPSNSYNFRTVGVGPKNLSEYNASFAAAIADPNASYIKVGVYHWPNQTRDIDFVLSLSDGPKSSGTFGNPGFPRIDIGYIANPGGICSDEYTRFAFINRYGFWDYYNVYSPLRKITQVDRSIYEKSFVQYQDYTATYNISDRGNTQYRTEYTEAYEITTTWLTDWNSQWLTQLFESPEVYIQENGIFIPVNILNTTVDWNMNQYRQKLFQYTIQFKYANDRITR